MQHYSKVDDECSMQSTESSHQGGSETSTSSSSSEATVVGRQQNRAQRSKTGCITCRQRKKRCDEGKPACATCLRLRIECLGYAKKRPDALRKNKRRAQGDAHSPETARPPTARDRRRMTSSESDHDYSATIDQNTAEIPIHDRHSSYTSIGNSLHQPPFQQVEAYSDIISSSDFRPPECGAGGSIPSWSSINIANSNDTWTAPVPVAVSESLSTLPTQDQDGLVVFGPGNQTHHPAVVGQAPFDILGLLQGFSSIPMAPNQQVSDQSQFQSQSQHQYQQQSQYHVSNTPDYSAYLNLDSPPGRNDAQQTVNTTTANSNMMHVGLPMYKTPHPQMNLAYLSHYLHAVVPLQYRLIERDMTNLIIQVANTQATVLAAASSLAALHLVTQRRKTMVPKSLPIIGAPLLEQWSATDSDARLALGLHASSLQGLKIVSGSDLTAEGKIISALFALSFILFCGGTSKEWGSLYFTIQRCLSAALAASPEFNPACQQDYTSGLSPWQRYRPLMVCMVWIDVCGAVTLNRSTPLLPTYQHVFSRVPLVDPMAETTLSMHNVMGCDDTTLLMLCMTVQLAEWKEQAMQSGMLSIKELMQRAEIVEKLIPERAWRETLLDGNMPASSDGPASWPGSHTTGGDLGTQGIARWMRDVWFAAAKVYLAIVVNGPFPQVPEVAAAVHETIAALTVLDSHAADKSVNRGLVFPITIAGCHCDTDFQKEFFRARFAGLGQDAAVFGNSSQALLLMEEVWKKRAASGPGAPVDWRKTMHSLGWEAGILLI